MKFSKIFSALSAVVVLVSLTAAANAFSPDRPTYTVAAPADHVVFNSITDNPREGDERTFFASKDATDPAVTSFSHQTTVHDGQEIVFRLYVNNNDAQTSNGTNLDGSGIAHNTKVRVALPSTASNSLQANAYISADNASPKEVSDTLNLVSANADQKFSLAYEPGSATASNNSVGDNGMKLDDSIVTSGAKIGYAKADGSMPAWFQYANVITLKATVHAAAASTAAFRVNQTVALTSDKTWSSTVSAKPGDKVKYDISFTNTGSTALTDAHIRQVLPKDATIVKGSAKLFNALHPDGQGISDDVATTGVAIGDYAPAANAYVELTATMPGADKLQCGDNSLVSVSHANVGASDLTGNASVAINKACANAAAPTTPAATPTPTATAQAGALVNTGAGSVLGLFAAVMVAGTFAYRLYLGHRLSSNN